MTSSEERRAALIHQIRAWGEARDAYKPGSPQYRKFQNLMKKAEWALKALGPSEHDPSGPAVVIKIVPPEGKPDE